MKQHNQTRLTYGVLFALFFLIYGNSIKNLHAYNQPPVNLSVTTFLDGGAPPGLYFIGYSLYTQGNRAVSAQGETISGGAQVEALTHLTQFYYLSKFEFLGAHPAIDVLLPVVSPTISGSFGGFALSANSAGLGDFLVGPAIQWDKASLLGGPIFQRVEFDLTFPTGKYDKRFSANPGSNLLTFNPYYSMVWLFQPKWDADVRLWYALHGENNETNVKPGQLFHLNYAVSREIYPQYRAGFAGYFLQQLTEDQKNGTDMVDSKERVAAIGPGAVYMGQGLTAMLSFPIEFAAKNRFQGFRATLELVHKF